MCCLKRCGFLIFYRNSCFWTLSYKGFDRTFHWWLPRVFLWFQSTVFNYCSAPDFVLSITWRNVGWLLWTSQIWLSVTCGRSLNLDRLHWTNRRLPLCLSRSAIQHFLHYGNFKTLHPNVLHKPPQLTLFDVEDQQLYFDLALDDGVPHPISEHGHPTEKKCLATCIQYLILSVMKGKGCTGPVNPEHSFLIQFVLYYHRQEQWPHCCKQRFNKSINPSLDPVMTYQ